MESETHPDSTPESKIPSDELIGVERFSIHRIIKPIKILFDVITGYPTKRRVYKEVKDAGLLPKKEPEEYFG